MKTLLSVILLLLCSSCVQLGGDSQPLRYYLLQPNAAAQPLQQEAVDINLEPIRLPVYLDRPQLTTHNDKHQVIIASIERWAEPLEENFSRVLQENLVTHLPAARIGSAFNQTSSSKNISVQMTINSFDGILGQHLSVDIRWTITTSNSPEQQQRGRFSDNTPIGDSYTELVQGLNSALDNFSATLAQALATQM